MVIGSNTEDAVREAAAYGADKILVVDGPEFKHYTNRGVYGCMYELVQKYGPSTMMIGATNVGRDMDPGCPAA